jgi:hypothetical protein
MYIKKNNDERGHAHHLINTRYSMASTIIICAHQSSDSIMSPIISSQGGVPPEDFPALNILMSSKLFILNERW